MKFPPERIIAALDHVRSVRQAYRDKYGVEEGDRRYSEMRTEENMRLIRKDINERIYCTGKARDFFNPIPSELDEQRFEARLREVYGDRYDYFTRERVMYDPRVAELLIADAMKTGAWYELPDDLQEVYWQRIKDGDGQV